MSNQDRPLSPHLQIYRWQWTMALSIVHRFTGVALSIGTLLLVWWIVALSVGPEAFDIVNGLIASWIGLLCLLGWTFALFYHLLNGLRHLAWDAGWGFELDVARVSGIAVAGAAAILTVLVWIAGYAAGGG